MSEDVERIVQDLTSRRGLRQEWEAIDDDVKDEIKETWAEIIASERAPWVVKRRPPRVTRPDDIQAGQYYWCMLKHGGQTSPTIEKADIHPQGGVYLGKRVWVDQAMEQYEIYGPIPRPHGLL